MKATTKRNTTTRKIVDNLGRVIYKRSRMRKATKVIQKFGYKPENKGCQFDILETNEYIHGLRTYWDVMKKVGPDYAPEW